MPRISPQLWEQLAARALAARRRAYAPYSRFKVGAALLAGEDRIVEGANVENASYGLSLCAERNAITTAIAEGVHDFRAMAIATPSSPPGPPCGLCLQMMAEFCGDLDLLLVNPKGERERTKLSKLAPRPFRWKGAGTPHWRG